MSLIIEQKPETAHEPAPQASNTGVLLTKSQGAAIILDWLAFTVPDLPENRKSIFDTFGVKNADGRGWMGYQNRASVLTTGQVFWSDDDPSQGIHVRLPSSALAEWSSPWFYLIEVALNNDGWITRLDLAFDDFEGHLDIDLMAQKLADDEVVTRFRLKERRTGKSRIGQPDNPAQTLEIGSRTSKTFIRVYDKIIQQASKGIETDLEHWTRVEIETKDERATEIAKRLADRENMNSLADFCAGVLLGILDFKIRNYEDTNKSRWVSSAWWLAFLGNVAKVKIIIPKIETTFERVKAWFSGSVAPMAAVLLLGDHGEHTTGYDWLIETIAKGENRFTKRHRELAGMTG